MSRAVLAALGAAAVLAATACGLEQDIAQRAGSAAGIGRPAPALSGTLLDGTSLGAATTAGHVTVVDFWGSWCVPCRAQQRDLDALARRYQAKGVVFVGVAMRDGRAAAIAYLARYGVPYGSLFDDDGSLAARWDVATPPTTLVVDAHGVLRARVLGGIATQDVPALLDRLLG